VDSQVHRPSGERRARFSVATKNEGRDAVIRKEGNSLIVEAVPQKSLLAILAKLTPLEEELPEIEDLPPRVIEL
jgi:hypothetical protein